MLAAGRLANLIQVYVVRIRHRHDGREDRYQPEENYYHQTDQCQFVTAEAG